MKALIAFALVGLSVMTAQAQGTIQFFNSALSRLYYIDAFGGVFTGTAVPAGFYVGAFWGTDAAGPLAVQGMGRGTVAGPTVISTAGGLFNGGAVYSISGTQEGQRIWLKIAAWAGNPNFPSGSITAYGESSVVNVVLGPTAGPGTVVWQGATGTATNRMKPFAICAALECPEPSTYAIGALGLVAMLLCRRRRAAKPGENIPIGLRAR